jgi:isopentenyl phosphate kinase
VFKILKLGGSVITYKNVFSRLNFKFIDYAIGDITKWLNESPQNNLILICGAGSFGHIIAHNHGVNNPTTVNKENYQGFLRVAINMQKMGNQIAEIFEQSGLHLFPISSSSMFITDKGRITDSYFQFISKILDTGLIPLFWGDSVLDHSHLSRILSGDQIASYLLEKFDVSEMLFGTNVSGIYLDDPYTNPNAEMVPSISNKNYKSVIDRLGTANSIDVTQGMRGKLTEIYETNKRPVNATIFDARVQGNIYRALKGIKVGTKISFK